MSVAKPIYNGIPQDALPHFIQLEQFAFLLVQYLSAWAEDRATVGTDPSADPGAKTEGRVVRRPTFFSTPFGIGTKALNPSGRSPEPTSKYVVLTHKFC
jgi:hypothetical protein